MGSRLFSAGAASFFLHLDNVNTTRTVGNLRTKENRATSKMSPGPAPPLEDIPTGVCYSLHFMKATTSCFIGSHRVSHPAAPLIKHTHKTHSTPDTHKLALYVHSTSEYPVCFSIRKMRDETSLEKQSPTTPSAHPDCFLDPSGDCLPQPALSPSAALWHSASHDQRHPARSKSVTRCDGLKTAQSRPTYEPAWRRSSHHLHA